MFWLHPSGLQPAVMVGRESDRGAQAGSADRFAPRRGFGRSDRCAHRDAVFRGFLTGLDHPAEAPTIVGQHDGRLPVDAGKPATAQDSRGAGVGVANGHVDTDARGAGVVLPLDRDPMGRRPKSTPHSGRKRRRPDRVDVEEAATDHGAAFGHVGTQPRWEVTGCLVRLHQCVDQQPSPDRAHHRSRTGNSLFAHD